MIEDIVAILPILIPLLIVELAFRVYSLIDLFKPHRESLILSKTVWAFIIGLINFGWVVYLLAGRKDVTLND